MGLETILWSLAIILLYFVYDFLSGLWNAATLA